MEKLDDGGAAFPTNGWQPIDGTISDDGEHRLVSFNGLSIRDYFAAKAMAAWLGTFGASAHHPCDTAHNGTGKDYGPAIAELSYKLADAMLSTRSKDPRP